MDRRRFLLGLAAGAVPTGAAAVPSIGTRLAAAWDDAGTSRIGILRIAGAQVRIERALAVPTRAHAIAVEPSGSLLACARRPGDWLMRWHRTARAPAVAWIEPSRSFNGHVIASPDGTRVYTTETDREDGGGLIGVRDASTLRKIDEWPTHGRDPHEVLWLDWGHGPRLAVANGGIATASETGRAKLDLDRMDSSLAMLDARTGALVGQWRLADPRLGLRHLACRDAMLAIALQAEHADPAARAGAPVMALFDGHTLRLAAAPHPLAGYGGAVTVAPRGFAVSCPRAGGVAHYDALGGWLDFTPLAQACALAGTGDDLWIGGGAQVLRVRDDAGRTAKWHAGGAVELDNHWAAL